MNLVLTRQSANQFCTLGELVGDGFSVKTLELPWIPSINGPGGQQGVSCVPAGDYSLRLHDSELHPRTFALSNPDLGVVVAHTLMMPSARTAILLHVANTPADLKGCIGLGTTAGSCVLFNSRLAYGVFQQFVPWVNGHTLQIKDGK